jgi:hypothetical protein
MPKPDLLAGAAWVAVSRLMRLVRRPAGRRCPIAKDCEHRLEQTGSIGFAQGVEFVEHPLDGTRTGVDRVCSPIGLGSLDDEANILAQR